MGLRIVARCGCALGGALTCPAVYLALALLLAAVPAAAQENPAPEPPRPERLYRAGLGLLVGSGGFGAAFDVSMNSGSRVYRLRLTGHDNAIASWQTTESVSIAETALMVGRGRRFTRNYGSLSAGLALVEVSRGGEDGDAATTLGVPVEAQLISGGPLKLGATAAANLNLERPFAAFVLSVQVGRVPAF